MELHEDDYTRIERYLQGKMLPAERAQFEADCAANQELAEALADVRDARLLARASRMLELRESLQAHARKRRLRPRIMRMIVFSGVAAAICLLLYVGFLQPSASAGLAGDFLAEDLRGGRRAPGDSLQQALVLLDNGDMAQALSLLRAIRNNGTLKAAEATYWMGIAFAIDEQRDSSRTYLQQFQVDPDGNAKHLEHAQKLLLELR